MHLHLIIAAAIATMMTQCNPAQQEADLILTGGTVYTVDPGFRTAEAVAVKDGRILATGSSDSILSVYRAPEVRDLEGKYVYPGWIDAHCHFFGYGMNLNAVDLTGTGSVGEILEILRKHQQAHSGAWITGRGWDQNDWEVQEFPHRKDLDRIFPGTPVLLRRIDGHAAWANTRALELAGVKAGVPVEGGTVMTDADGPTGILIDNAIQLVASKIPPPGEDEILAALKQAQENCFRVGLTSVQDAGLSRSVVELIDRQHREDNLQIRINAWLSPTPENYNRFVEKGPYRTERLSVNTVKLFADGALGSRGAWMIEPYSDDPGNTGLRVTPLEELEAHCKKAYANGYAVATHCIGDAANREVLRLYSRILEKGNDRRWRIEHAQIIQPADFRYFGEYGIIPSVQSTHATSDMYWAEQRLGRNRMDGAYAYRQLMEQNGWIANGSDFPVESINPLYGFYASVARKDHEGYPPEGFLMEGALSREEALRSMTIWAARAAFEEDLKGSIEPGKLADFVVTGKDLMTAPEEELFRIGVLATYVGGERVYSAPTGK